MIRTIMAAALAFAVTLPTAPAHAAGRERVFVASYGSDSNPCTFGSPCKTFQHAHDVVADSGEVTAIDSAGFGPITITKGVTITSPNGVEAGVVAGTAGTAILINATANDAVVLRGLTLEGANSANFGIVANSAGKIEIIDCVVRDFSQTGIIFDPNAQMIGLISNTSVLNNAVNGIHIDYGGTDSNVYMSLSHLNVADNNGTGIEIRNSVTAWISHSEFGRNGIGISMSGLDFEHMPTVFLRDTVILQSDLEAAIQMGSNSGLHLSQVVGTNVIAESATNAAVYTDGTNLIDFIGGPQVLQWPTN